MRRDFQEGDITMKYYMKASCILAVVCCVLYAGNGSADSWRGEARGVIPNVSVQDGNWNDTNTWLSGQVPTTSDGLFTDVFHNVIISDAQDSLDIVIAGGGSITVTPAGSHVGDSCCGVGVGASFSGPGTLIIEGTGTIIMEQLLVGGMGDTGTLVVRPTANGAPGLRFVQVNNLVTINANSVIELDVSLYSPVVDDSWVIIQSGFSDVTITGAFGSKVEPSGVTFTTSGARGGPLPLVTLTVTGFGMPDATMPAATYWGLGALFLVLTLAGRVYALRRRM